MLNAKIFTTEQELKQLTGLDHDSLWDNDFDIDDWDIGFQFDKKIHAENKWGQTYAAEDLNSPYWWLLSQMENYCAGPSYCEYKQKHYYIVHHA